MRACAMPASAAIRCTVVICATAFVFAVTVQGWWIAGSGGKDGVTLAIAPLGTATISAEKLPRPRVASFRSVR